MSDILRHAPREAGPASPPFAIDAVPLVLDLDGCLLRTDLLWETALRFVARAPWRGLLLLVWLGRHGRAGLKARLGALHPPLDYASLPIDDRIAAFAADEHAAGRTVHVATAADGAVARAMVGARFPFVSTIVASDGTANLKGPAKAERLQALFPAGFIYAGDSASDLHVWRAAHETVLVNADPSVVRRAERLRTPLLVLPRPSRAKAAWLALRPHQWAKNALLAVPLILGGAFMDLRAVAAVALAFAALSLIASATYVVNDLWDLDDDRRHWTKRSRPLASGALPIPHGIALAAGCLGLGIALGVLDGPAVTLGLLAYLATTLLYSVRLKREPIVDVLTLAGLFALRLAVGALAAGVVVSPWLLTFSAFLFLSLSLAKRHIELGRMAASGRTGAAGRGYRTDDAVLVLALGVGALLASIVVFVLYLTQDAFTTAHLTSPKLLWGFPPILFLLGSRLWLCSSRGELDDDPVSFALKDRHALGLGAAMGLIFVAAWAGLPWV